MHRPLAEDPSIVEVHSQQLRAAIRVEPKGMALESACGDAAYQPGGTSAHAQRGVRPPHGLQSGPLPRSPEGAVGVELGEEAQGAEQPDEAAARCHQASLGAVE